MFGWSSQFENKSDNVVKATEKAKFENLRHAVASMRKDAASTIRRRKNKNISSPEGTPPFTHVGFARQALRWFVDRTEAIMGFTFSKFGTVGATHEHGLEEEGRDYPERPTVRPALERGVVRFHQDWRATIAS